MRGISGQLGRVGAAALAAVVALGGLAPAPARAAALTAFTVSATTGVVWGGRLTLTASASPSDATGDVTFTFDGSSSIVPLTGGVASTTVAQPSVGPHTYSASYVGAGTYDPASDGPYEVTVARAVVAVTADAGTKTYGDADPTLTYQVTSGALAAGDAFTGALARTAGEDVAVTPYAITQGTLSLNAANYDLTFGGAGFAITPAPLVITPANKTKTAGQVFTAFTGTLVGLRGSDVITATYSSAGATASAAVGDYPITATPVDASGRLPNYGVTLNTGTLTVVPVPPVTTTVELTSSLNPAPPRGSVTLTAIVRGMSQTQGTLQLQIAPDGAPWADVGPAVGVTSAGVLFGASFAVVMPPAPQSIRYRAIFTSTDPSISGSTSPELAQVVAKAAAIVAISTAPAAWEVSIPLVIRATVKSAAASQGGAVAASGTIDFSIDGGNARSAPVVAGIAALPPTALAQGPHAITATYSGDASYLGGATASLTGIVAANLVNASGVGVSGSTIYPIKDGWRDTIAIQGLRSERLSVAIRIYSPAGRLVLVRTIPASVGSYASTWNGRNAAGTMLPAGTYRIVQTLADPSTSPALTKSWTSRVALSTRQMTWKTATLTVTPGPRNYRFSSGQGVGPSSSSSAGALALAGASGEWPAVGYEFTLPAASVYRQVRFQVLGSASGGAPTLGLHRWSNGAAWGQVYRGDFARTAVTPSTLTWQGMTSTKPVPFISSTGRVRGYVDGGGRLTSAFRFRVTGVRLVVVYGILR